MDLQPTLSGETVELRPIRGSDYAALLAVAADPQLWAQHPASDRWREEAFRAYFDTWLMRGGGLAVVGRSSGRLIGASCYSLEGRLPGEVEIGWTFLARDRWGGATNREVKRLMVGHALEHCERAVFRVAETNLRSRRALEKIGARPTGRSEDADVAGRRVRHVVYALDRAVPAERPSS